MVKITPIAKRILVVEDDRFIRESIEELLEGEGYHVSKAENGRVALECLGKESVDLILLDLAMPEMNGFEFREAQERNTKFASIPVVVMSAHGKLEENRHRIGAKFYISKPFEVDEALDTIQRAFR